MTAEDKRSVRARVRAARAQLPPGERTDAASALAARVLGVPGVAKASTVLGYAALPDEIDPAPLLAALRLRGMRVALPRVDAPAKLALHWVEEDDALEAGPFGIMEPAVSAPAARPEEIDLVLVPGVAFDAACNRLGYGGCFYDNLLPLLRPDALTVGLAYDIQVVPQVPAEDHDVAPQWVVTPTAVYRAS
jgi:5-formyltetrahydrofolate cyclo-ligase